jgi:hypothetical protein
MKRAVYHSLTILFLAFIMCPRTSYSSAKPLSADRPNYRTILNKNPSWTPSSKLLIGMLAQNDQKNFAALLKRFKEQPFSPENDMEVELESIILATLALQNKGALQLMIQVYGKKSDVILSRISFVYGLLGQLNKIKLLIQNAPDDLTASLIWHEAARGAIQGGQESTLRSLFAQRPSVAGSRAQQQTRYNKNLVRLSIQTRNPQIFALVLKGTGLPKKTALLSDLFRDAKRAKATEILSYLQQQFPHITQQVSRSPKKQSFGYEGRYRDFYDEAPSYTAYHDNDDSEAGYHDSYDQYDEAEGSWNRPQMRRSRRWDDSRNYGDDYEANYGSDYYYY